MTVTSLLQQLMNLPQSAAAPAPSNPHLAAVLQNKVLAPLQVPELGQPSRPELQIQILAAVATCEKGFFQGRLGGSGVMRLTLGVISGS